MEKEAEEERMRKQRAAAERAFQDGITKARQVMRRTPLGTDRNHNRLVLNTRNYLSVPKHHVCSQMKSSAPDIPVINLIETVYR